MKVISITSRTVKTYTVQIWNGEVRDCRYSSVGRRYRVTRVQVEKRDGNVSVVSLRGPMVRKDGSDGASEHTESLYRRADWPEWLSSIVGGLA